MALGHPDMKILIVDNLNSMRKILRSLLREMGYLNLFEAEDGAQGLSRLCDGDFDFVITELRMPNTSGIDMLLAIRANDKLKHIPVLVISAEATRASILEASKAKASGFIVKPFTAAVLHSKMDKIFEKYGVKQASVTGVKWNNSQKNQAQSSL